MSRLLWIQIKRKTEVPTIYQANHETRIDWRTQETICQEKIEEIFSYFRNGPIQTVSEFVYLIHEIFGAGHYMCIARAVNGAHFYLFLKFVCDNRYYKIEPTYTSYKKRKRKFQPRRHIKLINKIKNATNEEDRKFYEQELAYAEEQDREKGLTQNRKGPYPFLINTPRVGELKEMEDYREKINNINNNEETNEEEYTQGFW